MLVASLILGAPLPVKVHVFDRIWFVPGSSCWYLIRVWVVCFISGWFVSGIMIAFVSVIFDIFRKYSVLFGSFLFLKGAFLCSSVQLRFGSVRFAALSVFVDLVITKVSLSFLL